jgi:hypothetical protein
VSCSPKGGIAIACSFDALPDDVNSRRHIGIDSSQALSVGQSIPAALAASVARDPMAVRATSSGSVPEHRKAAASAAVTGLAALLLVVGLAQRETVGH